MTHDQKTVEAVARALFNQRAKATFGPYDAVYNASIRSAFEQKATALLDAITPQIVADAVKAEREAIIGSVKGKMVIAPLGLNQNSRAAWIDGAKAATEIFMSAIRARGNT